MPETITSSKIESVTISRKPLSEEEIDFLYGLYKEDLTLRDRMRRVADQEPLVLRTRERHAQLFAMYQGFIGKRSDMEEILHPPIRTPQDMRSFDELYVRIAVAINYNPKLMGFSDYLREQGLSLGIGLSDICDKLSMPDLRCQHCAPGDGKNKMMDWDNLTSLSPEFFQLFKALNIGFEGEPFLYKSKGKDLADLVEFLSQNGVNDITFSFGIFNERNEAYRRVAERLAAAKQRNPETTLTVRLTYLPFVNDMEGFEAGFKYAFDSCLKFADRVAIDALYDDVEESTSLPVIGTRFDDFMEHKVLNDYLGNVRDGKLHLVHQGRDIEIEINDPRVPSAIGDYKKYLETRGLLERHLELKGPPAFTPHCDSVLIPDTLYLRSDGSVKTCASFRYMQNPSELNLFETGYEGLLYYLKLRFLSDRARFLENLPQIINGTYSMCRCQALVVETKP